MHSKIKHAELALREQHQHEIAREYILVSEHEQIVQRELDAKYDANLKYVNELKQEHEVALSEIMATEEAKLEWVTNEKDRIISELQQKRTLAEVEETRQLM